MMFFAFAGKCGGLDAIGLADAAEAAPKSSCSLSNETSAMEPSPSAQRLKNWRRVRRRSGSFESKSFMAVKHLVRRLIKSVLQIAHQSDATEAEASATRRRRTSTPIR